MHNRMTRTYIYIRLHTLTITHIHTRTITNMCTIMSRLCCVHEFGCIITTPHANILLDTLSRVTFILDSFHPTNIPPISVPVFLSPSGILPNVFPQYDSIPPCLFSCDLPSCRSLAGPSLLL